MMSVSCPQDAPTYTLPFGRSPLNCAAMGIEINKKQKPASTEAAVFDTQYSSPAARPAQSVI
jgi:hypothetical protein